MTLSGIRRNDFLHVKPLANLRGQTLDEFEGSQV